MNFGFTRSFPNPFSPHELFEVLAGILYSQDLKMGLWCPNMLSRTSGGCSRPELLEDGVQAEFSERQRQLVVRVRS